MDALEVWLHGAAVGLLERFPDEEYRFSFDADWLADLSRPVLGQLFEDRRPGSIETSGLPGWFGHLLPQPSGPLYALLQREARSRGFVDDDGEPGDFFLLAMVGADLPGAVELRRGSRRWPALPSRPSRVSPAGPDSESMGLYPSLAGIQLKLSLERSEDRGFTVPVSGRGGRWIAKFDRDHRAMPRIEYATTCWARAAGVVTSEVLLEDISQIRALPAGFPREGQAFVSRRFDREAVGRIHMEDFGQILDRPMPAGFFRGSYEEIAVVVAALCASDVSQVIRRVAFAGLSREWDGHLKNWSLVYPDMRNAQLAPAYDLSAGVYEHRRDEDDQLVLSVGGSRRFEDLSAASFHAIGGLTGLGDEAGALAHEAGREIRAAWAETKATLPWRPTEIEAIERHMGRVPLGA